METTIEQSNEEIRNKMIFENMMEAFLKNWGPEDRYDKYRFEAELFSIIRQVYRDAQEPLLKQWSLALSHTPIFPSLVSK